MTSMIHRTSAIDFMARSTVNVDDGKCHPVPPDLSFQVDVRSQEDGARQFVLFVMDDLGRMQHRVKMNEGSVRRLISVLQGELKGKGEAGG